MKTRETDLGQGIYQSNSNATRELVGSLLLVLRSILHFTFRFELGKSIRFIAKGQARFGILVLALISQCLLAPTVLAQAASTVTLSSPGKLTVNDPINLRAKVFGDAPTGSVILKYDGGQVQQPIDIKGESLFSFAPGTVPPGSYGVLVSYLGDSKNSPSDSMTSIVQILPSSGIVTSTALVIGPNPAVDGGYVNITATVNSNQASGTVNLQYLGQLVASANVVNGVATFSGVQVYSGSYAVQARYEGDIGHLPSVSNLVTLRVNAAGSIIAPPVPSPVVGQQFQYDSKGNFRSSVTGGGIYGFGFRKDYVYNRSDSIVKVYDESDGETSVERNDYGQATKVVDPRKLQTEYTRTGFGDLKTLTSPDTGISGHTYDEAGNLKTRQDARGVLATFLYDGLSRPTQVQFTKLGMTIQTFTLGWDQKDATRPYGKGRLTSATFPSGSKIFVHDAQGRLTTHKQTANAQTGANASAVTLEANYGYSPSGQVQSLTYPSRRQVRFVLTNGELSAISVAATPAATTVKTLINNITWEPFGAPKSWQWALTGSARAHERVYDNSARLIRYPVADAIRDVAYDVAGRIIGYAHLDATTGALRPDWDQSFQYDEQSRLTKAFAGATTRAWEYDANGNRKTASVGSNVQTFAVFSTSNRLDTAANPTLSFGYDAVGNVTAKTGSGVAWTSTYDASGRMATITANSIVNNYQYDERGLRVRKYASSGAASTVLYVHDQNGQLIGEYDSAGKALREYLWLGNIPVGVMMPNPANPTGDPLLYAVQADHLNTPRAVMDEQWAARWRWVADAFGTAAAEDNPGAKGAFTFNLRFPGQIFDKETGLHYNWHRDFDPALGRYAQSDPIGLAGGINTYAYVGGNPLSYIDPFGLFEVKGYPGNVFDKRKYPPSVQELYRHAGYLERLINKACPGNSKVHDLYKKWVVEIVARGGAPTTRYGANTSEFTRDYFDISTHKPGAPDNQFTFIHEFMHLTDVNNLLRPSNGVYLEAFINGTSNDLLFEKNADQLVRDLMDGKCTCK